MFVKSNGTVRSRALSAVALAVLIGGATGHAANAASQDVPVQVAQAAISFDIAPQSLADALAAFGNASGLHVSAHGDLVRDKFSNGVTGSMPAEEALELLLAGTGLDFEISGTGAVIKAGDQSKSSATLVPIRVESARINDPHFGAADRSSSTYIDSETLRRRNPTTMRGVFSGESAVNVGGGIAMNQKIYVRGVEENNLAVSIDGARQNNKAFHHAGNTLMDPGLLKAARVDPSVAPADAGPGALGGSIVYETVDAADILAPGKNLGAILSGSVDSNSFTRTGSATVFGRHEGWEFLGFSKSAQGDNYEDGDGDEVEGSSADLLSLLGKLAYETKSGHRFEASAERVADSADRPFRANIRDITGVTNPTVREYDLTRYNYTARYENTMATGLFDPRVAFGYGGTKIRVPSPFGSVGETSSVSGRFENNFNLTQQDVVTAGVDTYYDRATYEDPTTPQIHEEAINLGVFAQARLQPLDPLRISFGMRGDQQWFTGVGGQSFNDNGISGNISAAYDIHEYVTVKGGYSNVWGGVALAENFIFNSAWDYTGGVDAVRARNYTGGVDVHYSGFTVNAGVFRSDFTDARKPNFRNGPAITTDFEVRGYELGAGYDWDAGFVRVSFTDTELEADGAFIDSDTAQYLGAQLGQVISAEAAHRFNGLGVLVGGTVDAALENEETTNSVFGDRAIESHLVFNLYAEYTPHFAENVTLRAEANNITDEAYADRSTYGQDFSTVSPMFEPGRSFLLKATAHF